MMLNRVTIPTAKTEGHAIGPSLAHRGRGQRQAEGNADVRRRGSLERQADTMRVRVVATQESHDLRTQVRVLHPLLKLSIGSFTVSNHIRKNFTERRQTHMKMKLALALTTLIVAASIAAAELHKADVTLFPTAPAIVAVPDAIGAPDEAAPAGYPIEYNPGYPVGSGYPVLPEATATPDPFGGYPAPVPTNSIGYP